MKTQMRFQKILLKVTLILAALAILYGVSFCTGAIGSIAHVMPVYNVTEREMRAIFGDLTTSGYYDLMDIYYLAQDYTVILFALGIVFILLVVAVYVFAGGKRRNYYLSNYITVGLVALMAVVYAVIAFAFSLQIQTGIANSEAWTYFGTYVAELLEAGDDTYKYTDSTAIYVIGYIFSVILIVDAVALVINLVWKTKLMKGEKKLLEGGATQEQTEVVKEVA